MAEPTSETLNGRTFDEWYEIMKVISPGLTRELLKTQWDTYQAEQRRRAMH